MKMIARHQWWFPRQHSLAALAVALFLMVSSGTSRADGNVVVMELRGGIGVATADYLISGIEHAEESNAELVIVNMDTPGGLMRPMRDIVQAILNSEVPIVTYVTPAGARADSAGTYILLASHIAAMAPTTHLGAATPVALTGDDATPAPASGDDTGETDEDTDSSPQQDPGTAMERKVINDAIAYIRGLAERYGRNADWAEEAVRDAATLTANEALEQNVIEFIARDQAELLQLVDGYQVEIDSATVTLATSDVVVEEYEPDWRIKILSAIANPEIVLLLGLIGIYGLMYEGWNPGAIVPGVVGVICLLLAAYALQVLPVNYAGLALILVGLALMTAEAFAPSFGALGLGGVAAFIFGAIMMFDSGVPGFGISPAFVTGLAVVAALLIIWMVTYVLRLRKRGAVSGRASIIGGHGIAMDDFTGKGKVWLEGEAWSAHSTVPIKKDQAIVVLSLDGLTLEVKPAPEPDASDIQLQT
jgi:membrane-bound serine protease (ClpP class)